jgi:hypothetical protein
LSSTIILGIFLVLVLFIYNAPTVLLVNNILVNFSEWCEKITAKKIKVSCSQLPLFPLLELPVLSLLSWFFLSLVAGLSCGGFGVGCCELVGLDD